MATRKSFDDQVSKRSWFYVVLWLIKAYLNSKVDSPEEATPWRHRDGSHRDALAVCGQLELGSSC